MEALVLAGAWFAFYYYSSEFQAFASSLELNEEVLKYLMLLPVALAVWVFNEIRVMLQEDKETVRILTGWQDYWKLKTHAWVSLSYSVVFACISLTPWLAKTGISTGNGLLLFLTSIFGQFSLAMSVYAASIRVKEIIAQAESP